MVRFHRPCISSSRIRNWISRIARSSSPRSSLIGPWQDTHGVLAEALPVRRDAGGRDKQVLLLSARTPTALEKATDNLIGHLEDRPELDLADVAYTLQVGRRTFPHRRAVVFELGDRDELLAALKARTPERVYTTYSEISERPVVFLFSGQGTQYVDM